MKTLGLLLLVALVSSAFGLQEPYPGQREHKEPPAEFFCQHQNADLSVPPAHVCECHRKCYLDTAGGEHETPETSQCTVFCWKDHCHCPVEGCPHGS